MFFFKLNLKKAVHSSASRGNAQSFFPRKILVMMIMFCLLTGFLLSSCKEGGGGSAGSIDNHKLNSDLIGTWTSNYGDSYTITSNKITYYAGYDSDFVGTIQYVSNFTDSAGVIIVKYDDGKKPSYWEYDKDWNPIKELPLKGDFIGIYYNDLKSGVSVSIANAYIYGGAEEATLDNAKKAFTAGNEGKYIMSYGEYSK